MIKTKCIGVCRNVLSFAFAQDFRQYTLIPYTLNTCIFIFFALLLHASAYGAKPETGLIKHRRMENNPSPNAWYHLWVPPSYTPSEPLPLYIFLHGGHVGSGTADNIVDLRRIVPHMKNSITLFPNHIFWFWSHPDETIYVITIMEKLLDTYSIDRTRIYVMGSSMGGNGAMHFAARFPEMFAACAPMACWCRFIPVKQAAVMPIYSAHGKKDRSVPIKWARDIRRRLKGIKGLKLKYRELDCGHQLPMNVIKDAAAWISTFRNPRTFDIKKMKERARALPHAR